MSFDEYYQHYLSLHQNKTCRRLHLMGFPLTAILLVYVYFNFDHWWVLLFVPLIAYPCAWIGHVCFEKNRPASWKNPILANLSEARMVWDIVCGRIEL